jgi:hypothetical protein
MLLPSGAKTIVLSGFREVYRNRRRDRRFKANFSFIV